jgi:hypothetical protein
LLGVDEPLSRAEVEAAERLAQLLGVLDVLHRIAQELVGGPAYSVAESLILHYRRRLSYELAALESAPPDERAMRRQRGD